MNRYRAVTFVLVTALFGAACGGGGKAGKNAAGTAVPAPGSSTSTAPPTTAPTAASVASSVASTDPAKAAKAKAATLQPADFPAGFAAQPEAPGQGLGIETVWEDLTRCLGVENTGPPAGIATSPTFLRDIATQGRSTVEYTTEASATAIAAALAGPKFGDCAMTTFAADLGRSKPEGSTAGAVKVASRDAVKLGQKSMAWRITASVNLGELMVPLFQDFLVIFDKGTVIRMFFLNPGSEFPQTLERSLVEKVVSRA